MECVEYSDASAVANDRITPLTLTTGTPALWAAITFSAYTTTAMPTTTYTYTSATNPTKTTTINGDMKTVTFRTNTYTSNTVSNGFGILDFLGVPRVNF